jgi:hypothetical protein
VIFSHPSFAGKIGFAQSDITPPIGIYARNWGAASHDVAEGIHRPLHARVLALQSDDGETSLLLVSLDLGWWKTREDEWLVRGALLEEFELDEARVLVSLTHTHAGPVFCREDFDKPGGEFIAPYLEKVRAAVLVAARRARGGSTPATLEWAWGKCTLAQNRDLPDPQRERILCGFQPDAEADDTLLVGRVTENETGKLLCVLANYACHPTTLAWENRLISPDWLGAFYETIETQTGAPALFLQGASGELQPRETFIGDTKIADAQGRQFAFAVLSTLAGMLPPRTALEYSGAVESGAPLAMWQRIPHQANTQLSAKRIEIEMPLKEGLESAPQLQSALDACNDRTLRERLTRKMRVRRTVGEGGSTLLPVWVWQIGDAVFIAQREEAYSFFQKELRAQFPNKAIIVMNLTNGSCGYLPPRNLYDFDIYQVWQTPYARGAAEILLETVRREIALA